MPIDARVKAGCALSTEEFRYRTPIKFGGVALDRVTLLALPPSRSNSTAGRVAVGRRVDAVGERLGLPVAVAELRPNPRGDAGRGRRNRHDLRAIDGRRAPHRHHARAGTGVRHGRRRTSQQPAQPRRKPVPALADPRGGVADRRGPARRLRQGAGAERLPHPDAGVPAARPGPLPRGRIRRAPRLHDFVLAQPPQATMPCLPPRRCARPADGGRTLCTTVGDGLPETLADWITTPTASRTSRSSSPATTSSGTCERVLGVDAVAEVGANRRAVGSTPSTSTNVAPTRRTWWSC